MVTLLDITLAPLGILAYQLYLLGVKAKYFVDFSALQFSK